MHPQDAERFENWNTGFEVTEEVAEMIERVCDAMDTAENGVKNLEN